MKKFLPVLLAVMLITVAGVAGCADRGSGIAKKTTTGKKDIVELRIFAAASMTESLNQLSKLYSKKTDNIKFSFSYGSSGDLQTQIENGAEADIFISAAEKQMDALAKKQLIDEATRKVLLMNKVVLVVPKDADTSISSFKDPLTDKVKLIAIGNADVPVGQYTEQIYKNLKGWDTIKKKASFGSNVKEVLSQVEKNSVDCGIVYTTDAQTSDGVKTVAAAPENTHDPVVYPEAVLKHAAHPEAARKFLNFLETKEAKAVFKKVGFTFPKDD